MESTPKMPNQPLPTSVVFVIGELCEVPSSWRSQQSLANYFKEHQIIGIEDIDTRALTKHLRDKGAMRAVITTELSEQAAIEAANEAPPMAGSDFVREVSTENLLPLGR